MNRQRPSKSSTFPYSRHEIGTADFTVPRRLPSGWGIGRRQEAATKGLWRSAASPIPKGQSWWKQKHISAENKYGPRSGGSRHFDFELPRDNSWIVGNTKLRSGRQLPCSP